MKIVGISYYTDGNGNRNTTLHVTDQFDGYFSSEDKKRGCAGERVETVYVGSYDCSKLKLGMNIDISYDKAITTSRGSFQRIKRIDVIEK